MSGEPRPLGDDDMEPWQPPISEEALRAAEERLDQNPEPSVREQIRAMRTRARRDLFEKAVPERFREATYDDLQPDQAPDVVRRWLASGTRTLFLVGQVGTGKTHAAYAVLREAAQAGAWVYASSMFDLLAALKPKADPSPLPRLAETADLFLFDDLAAERATEWAVSEFGGIVDERTREGKRQIVTTNADYNDLVDLYSDRVMSRLGGGATVAQFTGKDRRKSLW